MFNLSKAEDALKSALKVLLNDKLIQGKSIILDYFLVLIPFMDKRNTAVMSQNVIMLCHVGKLSISLLCASSLTCI